MALRWLSVVKQTIPIHFSGFRIAELRIHNLVDRCTHRSAECGAVTFDLAKRIITASLRASKHSIETLEGLDPIHESLGHHLIRCKVGPLQNFYKIDANLGVPSGPLLRKACGGPSVPPERLLPARLLQLLYSIRSERRLVERLAFDMLFRWFVGCRSTSSVFAPRPAGGEGAFERGAFFGRWNAAEGMGVDEELPS
jgi:hypothetical protein